MLNRVDGEGWAWPGGGLKDGETPEEAAWRECWEETGHRCGGLKFLMRRVRDGVDFSTYIADCDSEFVPAMNHEHDSHMWADPEAALEQAKAANGSDPLAIADSAALETPPMLYDEDGDGLDDRAPADDDDLDGLGDLILAEIETLEARLAKIEEADDEPDPQLDRESLAQPAKTPEPVHGASAAADLQKALDEGIADWSDDPVERDDRKAAQRIGTRFRSV